MFLRILSIFIKLPWFLARHSVGFFRSLWPYTAIPYQINIMSRFPEEGKCKQRLAVAVGNKLAATAQREMTENIVRVARGVWAYQKANIAVYYTGCSKQTITDWLGDGVEYREQLEGGLGQRILDTFRTAFSEGREYVVICGSDIPGITSEIIHEAFVKLKQSDLVVGPAVDGGYYLLGLRRPSWRRSTQWQELFEDKNISWCTSTVFTETMQVAARLKMKVSLLTQLSDIDTIDDFPVWEKVKTETEAYANNNKISVIIPALNEEKGIAATLTKVLTGVNIQVIVVDGGSSDNTVSIAEQFPHTNVVRTEKGRANQLNCGANYADGKIVMFLHADTLLVDSWDVIVRKVLQDKTTSVGAFEFKVARDVYLRGIDVVERTTNWRARDLQLPYGDQSYFLARKTFQDLSGFPNFKLMEDFEFIKRAAKIGKIKIANCPAITSSRRWKAVGLFKTTFINWSMVTLYSLGVPPDKLAALYYSFGNRKM